MVSKRLYNLHEAIDFIAIVGGLLGVGGAYWDIRYHIDVGRDSFWIPPHLMVYGGILLTIFGCLLELWRSKQVEEKYQHRTSFVIAAILVSVLFQISAAPVDDWWHDTFGLDVTVWSPPHLWLILGGILVAMSCIYFQRLYMYWTKEDRLKRVTSDELKLELMFAIVLVALNIVLAEFEYFRTIPLDWLGASRPFWLYLFGLSLEFAFVFTLAKVFIKQAWSATRISLFYTLIKLVISVSLFFSGSWPILPPLVILPAVVFDLIFEPEWKRLFICILAFIISFYAVEAVYLNLIGIGRFIPSTLAELIWAVLGALLVSVLGYFIGEKLMKHIDRAKV